MIQKGIKQQLETLHRIFFHILNVRTPHMIPHISRVPILALMIADALKKADKNIKLSADDIYQLEIASKLHDCGKITTPDYLLSKSTKTEFVRNRIHEIRNRFEILRRDAEIAALKKIIAKPKQEKEIKTALKKQLEQLEKDFAFVAQCNLGETAVDENCFKKLQKIGNKKFKRYFSRLEGLSWNEIQALSNEEKLKYQNAASETVLQDNPEDFYQGIPTGELHNLSTFKGTLSPEERQKIEQHAIETENILKLLKLPKSQQNIAIYAAQHHERPNGKGYPHGLKDNNLCLASKILTLADIFEAITSSERPYKAPKKLSEALHILQSMKNNGQLDKNLYELFLRKKIYLQYAKQYLSPEQIDEINIDDYL